VVFFIVAAANDLDLIPPLMLSVVISLLLNRLINDKGFDEEQILRKGIPFLPAEPPGAMEEVTAAELCDPHSVPGWLSEPLSDGMPEDHAGPLLLPGVVSIAEEESFNIGDAVKVRDAPNLEFKSARVTSVKPLLLVRVDGWSFSTSWEEVQAKEPPKTTKAILPQMASVETVRKVLGQKELKDVTVFAIVNKAKRCVGFTIREWLEAALQAQKDIEDSRGSDGSTSSDGPKGINDDLPLSTPAMKQRVEAHLALGFPADDALVPIENLSEGSPFMIASSLPAARFYSMFVQGGVRMAAVVTPDGKYCGMITRSSLIASTRCYDLPKSLC